MKFRVILYTVLSIAFQLLLGYLTGLGQGGIGMLLFIVLMELDPKFRFSYLFVDNRNTTKKDSDDGNL